MSNLLTNAQHKRTTGLAPKAAHQQVAFTQLLDLVDVVSFDLFDTLLERQGLFSPKDLFYQVQMTAEQQLGLQIANFTALRLRAETMARVRAWGQGCEEVTLNQIYLDLYRLLNCGENKVQRLQQIELQCERAVLQVLPSGQVYYKAALAAGKKVVITSDTYFTDSFITEILQHTGYETVHKLYLSAALGKTKQEGSLYDLLLQDLTCAPSRLLHVGDNQLSDITMALGRGIRTFYVPTTKHFLRWRNGLNDSPSGDLTLSALLCKLSQHTPATEAASTPQSVMSQTATENLALLYYAFAAWLVTQVKAGGHRRVYFAAREGFIIKRFFELIAHATDFTIDTRYLYVSRAALYPSLIFTDPEAARQLFSRSWDHLTLEEAMGRLSLSFDEHKQALRTYGFTSRIQRLDAVNAPQFQSFLAAVWPLLESKNEQNYQRIVAYLRQELVLNGEKAAFVDIGWHGSLQTCLAKVLKSLAIDKEFHGYYLGTFTRSDRTTGDAVAKGYLVTNEVPYSLAQLIRSGPSLLELLHSANHGSVLGYREEGDRVRPVLENNPLEQQQFKEIVEPLQTLAFEFVAHQLTHLTSTAIALPEPELVARIALRPIYAPTAAQASFFGRLSIASDFGGRMKSITGAAEWNLQKIEGDTLPDGTVPIWRPGFQCLKQLG